MPDSPRHQAGPVGASSHSNVQGSVSGSRPSAASGLFGGRGTAFVVLALSLAITISWSIRFQALPGSGAAGGTGAMFLAAGAIIISLLLFGLVWILTTARLRAEALALEMTLGAGRKLPVHGAQRRRPRMVEIGDRQYSWQDPLGAARRRLERPGLGSASRSTRCAAAFQGLCLQTLARRRDASPFGERRTVLRCAGHLQGLSRNRQRHNRAPGARQCPAGKRSTFSQCL